MTTRHTLTAELDFYTGSDAPGLVLIEAVGTNDDGDVVVIPAIRDETDNVIFTGPQKLKLVEGMLLGHDGGPCTLPDSAPGAGYSPMEWSYRVTLQLAHLTKKDYPVFIFQMTADMSLADVLTVPPASMAADAPWAEDAERAESARDDAEAAAATVQRGLPNGTAPLDGAALVPDANLPARLGASVLASTYVPVTPVPRPANMPAFAILPQPKIRRLGGGRFHVDVDYSSLIPPAGVAYYVAAGASGSGNSAADPAKVADAVAKADVGTLLYLPGEYRRESAALAATLTKNLRHVALGPGVRVTAWNADLAWTLETGAIYKTTRSATTGVVDILNLTTEGDFTSYEKKADLASITGPGQWAIVGSIVYVWAIGSTNLSSGSNAGNQLRLSINANVGVPAGPSTRQYVKGIEFEGMLAGGLGAASGATIFAQDYRVRYVPGTDAVTISGAVGALVSLRGDISSVNGDAASYRGAGSEFLEIDCKIRDAGVVPGATNNNATTAHAGARGIRIGGDYKLSGGPVLADVNSAKTWNLGCKMGRSMLTNSGSVAADATGYESDPAEIWLDECELADSDYAFRTYSGPARIHLHGTRHRARKATLYPTDVGTVDYYTPSS